MGLIHNILYHRRHLGIHTLDRHLQLPLHIGPMDPFKMQRTRKLMRILSKVCGALMLKDVVTFYKFVFIFNCFLT